MNKKRTEEERRETMQSIHTALLERGYDPIRQLRGYLLSDDPTYIPDHRGARASICGIDREALLDDLLRLYFDSLNSEASES